MLCRALAICMPLGRDGVTLHCSMPKLPTECGLQCKLISLSLLCSSLKMIFILEIGKSVYVLYQSRYSQIRTKKCLIDADNISPNLCSFITACLKGYTDIFYQIKSENCQLFRTFVIYTRMCVQCTYEVCRTPFGKQQTNRNSRMFCQFICMDRVTEDRTA